MTFDQYIDNYDREEITPEIPRFLVDGWRGTKVIKSSGNSKSKNPEVKIKRIILVDKSNKTPLPNNKYK